MSDPATDDDLLDFLDQAGKDTKPLGAPGMFHHFGRGLGDSAMGGLARVGRAAAVTAPGILKAFGAGLTPEGEDAYYGSVVKATEDAVDYWTPDAANVGTAGHVVNGLVQGLVPLATGPVGFIATTGIDSSIEVVKGGGTVKQAVTVGTINATAAAVGYKMPAAWGTTLATRVATGTGGNVAIDAASRVAAQAALADNPDLADQYAVTGESTAVSALMGAAFGVVHHVGAGKVPREATQAERDAVLAVSNADHFARETMPGEARDGAAVTAHQDNLAAVIRQAINGEPINAPHQDLGKLFNLRPEVAGAPDVAGYDSMRVALESGGRADAAASTSGALGIDQFIPDTWRRVVRKAQPAWADGLTDAQ
ncbi:MAG: hypothetical protein M3Q15_05195, partial [Pseudomonadota bacterium]|nr:hypothetical protein [Pseudomonadota bacterium]